MKHISLTVSPEDRFPVPYSTGYSLYAGLLNVIQDSDEDASAAVHDRDFGGFHNSGLLGSRVESDLEKHKDVIPGNEYQIELGVTDPEAEAVFDAVVKHAVLGDAEIPLSHGTLNITEFSSRETSHEELVAESESTDVEYINIDFRSPVCIHDGNERTAMYPHRVTVFRSIANRWNRSVRANGEDHLTFDFSNDEIRDSLIDKPGEYHLSTVSVLVNRVPAGGDDDVAADGGSGYGMKPRFKQGFTGHASYRFKGATESMVNALQTLARFAEISGVGAATARGCGHVEVDLQ